VSERVLVVDHRAWHRRAKKMMRCRCLVNLSAASVEYARPVLKAVPALTMYLEATDVRLNEHVRGSCRRPKQT
jgi:hypothetical protein